MNNGERYTSFLDRIRGEQDTTWMDDALCAQVGGDLWHPEKGESTRAAKSVCARCPVAVECLEYALVTHERFGVYGGMSEGERRRLARQLGYSDDEAAA